MNNKYLPYYYAFNHEILAKELFLFKNSKIRSIIHYNIRNNSNNLILSLVSRYLLHVVKIPATIVRVLIRRYSVLIAYSYIKSVSTINSKELFSEKLDYLLDNVSVDNLVDIEDDSLIGNIYNDIEYSYNIFKLDKLLKPINNGKVASAVYKLLRADFNYFSSSSNLVLFDLYPNIKRLDMIVSEAMIKTGFVNFSFAVEYESFIKNIKSDNITPAQVRMAITYVGYIVYEMFERRNLKFKSAINFISNNLFVLATSDKNASAKNTGLSFVEINNNEVYLNTSNIIEFNFIYNGINCSFSSKGIKYRMTEII